jgi:predicted XRE-type DNA-binding protein
MSDEGELTPSSGNVFADLGLPDPDLLLAKAELAIAITTLIRERGLTQSAAARLLGVHQSRISAITRGRLDDFSLERLMSLARGLGQDVQISVTPGLEPDRRGRLTARRREGLRASSGGGGSGEGGLRAKSQLLETEGGVVSGRELAQVIGITRQAVDKRRLAGKLIGIDLGKRGYAYPVWQIGLDGLDTVLAELAEYDPWAQALFMLSANSWLQGETPLAMLRLGNLAEVLAAVRLYGEQTAA